MKKLLSLLMLLSLLAGLCLCMTGCGADETLTLNVYNWGEYISDGSEGSFYTIREFEKWYEQTYGKKVKVNYETFASNEDMFAKLSTGAVSYDVIIPSDYMIARMAQANMLLPLNFENIPNYANIDDSSTACITIRTTSIPFPTPTASWASSTTPIRWIPPTLQGGS